MIGSYLERCNDSKELLMFGLIPPACYPLISFYHQAGSGSLLLGVCHNLYDIRLLP